MHFDLVDRVLERSDTRIVTLKHVSSAEEYLQDHFPTFPVLPGVLMLEAMVQAARRLCDSPGALLPLVLGQVRALKYGRFVKPGDTLHVEVHRLKGAGDGTFDLRGEVSVLDPSHPHAAPGAPATACSGRFVLRPMKPLARQ